MSIKKQYLKTRPVCKVRFKLSGIEAKLAAKASVVGEFNDWDIRATPMEKLKDGTFTATVDLEIGRDYQFRYLLDESIWETDFTADKFVQTPFTNGENSIVVL